MATFSPLCGNHVRKFVEEHIHHSRYDAFGMQRALPADYESSLIDHCNTMADMDSPQLELALSMNLPVTSAIAGALLNEREEAKRAYQEWSKSHA